MSDCVADVDPDVDPDVEPFDGAVVPALSIFALRLLMSFFYSVSS